MFKDEYAVRSHKFAAEATEAGKLTDILPYKVPSKWLVFSHLII